MDLSPTNSTRVQSHQRAPNAPLDGPSLTDQQNRTHQVAEEALGTAPSETEVLQQSQGDVTREQLPMEIILRLEPEHVQEMEEEQLIFLFDLIKNHGDVLIDKIKASRKKIHQNVIDALSSLGENDRFKEDRPVSFKIVHLLGCIDEHNRSIHNAQKLQETKDLTKEARALNKRSKASLKKTDEFISETDDFLVGSKKFLQRAQQHSMPSASSSDEHELHDPIEEPIFHAQPNLPIDRPPNNGNNHCLIVALIISGMYFLYMGVTYVSNCLNNRSIFRGSSNDGGEL